MLKKLPSPFIALITYTLLVVNTVLLALPLIICTLIRCLLPVSFWQVFWTRAAIMFAELWMSFNGFWMQMTQGMNWHVQGLENLSRNQWYFVIGNHQSAADIFIAQYLLNKRTPMLKFFLKQELIYVPIIGLCWWALDFPFMKRYSASYLKKHPNKRGKDFESTQKACEKFKHSPVAVMNYVEGTRFSKEKHSQQKSPYQFLLKPKSGGFGYALSAMGDCIDTLLVVSIFYPGHSQPSMKDFMSGKVDHVCIDIREQKIPQEYLGQNYQQDSDFRRGFTSWLNEVWTKTDQTMLELKDISESKGWSKP